MRKLIFGYPGMIDALLLGGGMFFSGGGQVSAMYYMAALVFLRVYMLWVVDKLHFVISGRRLFVTMLVAALALSYFFFFSSGSPDWKDMSALYIGIFSVCVLVVSIVCGRKLRRVL